MFQLNEEGFRIRPLEYLQGARRIRMKIIVPATSANIGPGFDSVGVAVTSIFKSRSAKNEMSGWLNTRLAMDSTWRA